MTNVIFLLISVLFIVLSLELRVQYLHIFQLSYYKYNEYGTWIQSHYKTVFSPKKMVVLLSILGLLVPTPYSGIVVSLLYILAIFMGKPAKAKKPLVYTARVKRMLITSLVVDFLVCLYAYWMMGYVGGLMFPTLIYAFVALMSAGWFLLSNVINTPIEKGISRWYYNDAKRKLSSMKNLTVVGVTGSYGKTSTKYFLERLLSKRYQVLMTPGNLNTTLGVVRTIREHLNATHEIFIAEMGAKYTGDIKEICDLVHPKYGIISSIGPQHLETFKTMENVVATKCELADSLPANGKAFFNADDRYLSQQTKYHNIVTYGVDTISPDYRAVDLFIDENGSHFIVQTKQGENQHFSTKLMGKHNVQNILGAIAVANTLGITLAELVRPVGLLESVPHRLQLLKGENVTVIDDAYNSNPVGSKMALEVLSLCNGDKYIITPGMVELGEKQYECNYDFGKQIAAVCDGVVLVGEKQTLPIYNALIDHKFELSRLFVVDTVTQGMERITALPASRHKFILLENDLPDNY